MASKTLNGAQILPEASTYGNDRSLKKSLQLLIREVNSPVSVWVESKDINKDRLAVIMKRLGATTAYQDTRFILLEFSNKKGM